jgi:hypothetical protein
VQNEKLKGLKLNTKTGEITGKKRAALAKI